MKIAIGFILGALLTLVLSWPDPIFWTGSGAQSAERGAQPAVLERHEALCSRGQIAVCK